MRLAETHLMELIGRSGKGDDAVVTPEVGKYVVDVIIDYLSFSESLCFSLFQLFVGKCLSQGLLKKRTCYCSNSTSESYSKSVLLYLLFIKDISKRIDVMLSKLSSNLKVTWYKKDK
jgi:hypothetical protein